jgi:predicted molibdopterin-dependent oxidoreductase YjgC
LRILDHPVLGRVEAPRQVAILFEGITIPCVEGEPIAAALAAAGIRVLHFSNTRHEPRGLFCALGRCNECRMVVDGVFNVRTCITPVRDGMTVKRQHGHGTVGPAR